MNWKLWLEGLAFTVAGGAATGITQLASSTGQVTKGTGGAAIGGALLALVTYLRTPPTATNQAAAQQAPADPTAPAK